MLKRILCAALASGALVLSGSVAAQELKIALIAGKTGPLEAYAKDTEKGFMLGLEVAEKEKISGFAPSDKTASIQLVNRLHEAGVLAIPSGSQIVRLLPPLNLTPQQADEGIKIIESVVSKLA